MTPTSIDIMGMAGAIILILLSIIGFLLKAMFKDLKAWKQEIATQIQSIKAEGTAQMIAVELKYAALDKRLALIELQNTIRKGLE